MEDTPSKRITGKRFPELTVTGTPYEMGVQIGSRLRDPIQQSLNQLLPQDRLELIQSRTLAFERIIAELDPLYMQEIAGIRDGAEIERWKALYLHTRWDINLQEPEKGECTTFAIPPAMTVDGEVYAGTNHDVSVWAKEQALLLTMRPADGPRLMMMTYPGSIALDGMNEYGLCLCGNSLYGKRNFSPMPHGLFKRMLLRQPDVASCVEMAQTLVQSGLIGFSGNFTLCDIAGNMACLELICGKLAVIAADRNEQRPFLAHTNHLLTDSPEHVSLQGDWQQSSNTVGRLERFQHLMSAHETPVDLPFVQRLLSDHTHYPGSICSHVSDSYHTAYSAIMLPRRKLAYISYGNPCQNQYQLYRLNPADDQA
jgi:isopenicillin-N N-acyltransferase-like protein